MTAIEPSVRAAPLIGRRTEIEQITALAERVSSGHGGAFVLIEGEPGIGKTSLLHRAAAVAVAEGMCVLRGAAIEAEQPIAGAAIGSCVALDERCAIVAGDRPGSLLDSTGAQAAVSEFAATATMSDLLVEWCSDGPVAVLLDDIHWADAASLSVLRWLSIAAETMPLLVVATMRPYPLGPGLPRLLSEFDAVGVRRIMLGPLADAEVTRLVERSLGAPPGPRLAALTEGAAGNPLYLTDLLDGLPADDPGIAVRDLPDALSERISRRLDFLPDAVRRTLEAAAALTPRIDPVKLAEILGVSLIEVWHQTRTAVEARVLVHDGDELVFQHELIRRVLAGRVSPSIRAALCRQVEVSGLHLKRIAEPVPAAEPAVPVRRAARPPRPETGWEALTAAERKVAVEVAQGCSDAEIAERMFLSRRTVQTHVSRILAKLGLRSRVQVAAIYAQRRAKD